jgi:hypothetical protein
MTVQPIWTHHSREFGLFRRTTLIDIGDTIEEDLKDILIEMAANNVS